MHVLRGGDSYSAAHYLRAVLATDDRPRTMHAEAERADRELLPGIGSGSQLTRNVKARAPARGVAGDRRSVRRQRR